MSGDATSSESLGSLAQSARTKQLKSARAILLFVGILTVAVNAYFFSQIEGMVRDQFDAEVQKLMRQGMVIDQGQIQELQQATVKTAKLICGAAIMLGVVFIVFGVMVNQYPVPITVTSLILYVGAIAVFGLLDPMTLLSGIIVKVIIIAGLGKAIGAALAYEKERKNEQSPSSSSDPTMPPPGLES